jgi:hypothetical protein
MLSEVPVKSLSEHAQLLGSALGRLTQSKESFEGRIEKAKRQHEDL